MGRRGLPLVTWLVGLIAIIGCIPDSNSHQHSVSYMLSNLFIEPQSYRAYRSTSSSSSNEDEQNIEADVIKMNKATPSQSSALETPEPSSTHRLNPSPVPNRPGSGVPQGPPRVNPGPPRPSRVVHPRPDSIVHPGLPKSNLNPHNGPNPNGPFVPRPNLKGPPAPPLFRPPQSNFNLPPDGQTLNPNFPQQPSPHVPSNPPRTNPVSKPVPSSNAQLNSQVPNANIIHDQKEVPISIPKPVRHDLSKQAKEQTKDEPMTTSGHNSPIGHGVNPDSPPTPVMVQNQPFLTDPTPPLNPPPPSPKADSFIPQREAQFFSNHPRPRPPHPFLPGRPFHGRAPQPPLRGPHNIPPPIEIIEEHLMPPHVVRRDQCIGVNGSMIGECTDPFACEESGGKTVGPCPNNNGPPQVCCSFVSFCNFMTNVERAYLSSPNYPKSVQNLESCAFQLSPLADVCQVRIDFLDFHLKPPVNGVCDDDNSLHIESNDPNAFIPVKKLCGTLSEENWDPLSEDVPHMYVHFKSMDDGIAIPSDKSPPKRLRYPNKPENLLAFKIKVKNAPSSWNIRINQISCDGGARQQAPFGCAQYFTGENGMIQSLNYNDNSYLTDLDITSCIMSDPESCGIAYKVKNDVSIGDVDGLSFGLKCPGDYAQFSGEKAGFCGSLKTNETFFFENNKGPLSLHFHSDSRFNRERDLGFSLNYERIYNCRRTEFFDYNQHGI